MSLSPLVLFSLVSLCPLAIVNPTPIPVMSQKWAVTSTASNSARPTTIATLINPGIDDHDDELLPVMVAMPRR